MTTHMRGAERASPSPLRTPPHVRGLPIVGVLPRVWRDPLGTFLGAALEHGEVVQLNLGRPAFVLSAPEHVRHVLQDHASRYRKSFMYDRLKPVLGEGLVTSEGPLWQKQRRLIQPSFHREHIANLVAGMTEQAEKYLARWRAAARAGQVLDVADEMVELTLSVAGRALFGVDLSDDAQAVGPAIRAMFDVLGERVHALFNLPASIPSPANRRLRRVIETLDDIVLDIIRRKRRSDGGKRDMLDMLMASFDEDTNQAMEDKQLRDEVMTMLVAGHETTAHTLSWTLFQLSKNPAIVGTMRDEIRRVLGTSPPRAEHVPKLRYVQQVIEETMRMFPAAWLISRDALEDDEVGGYRIPKHSTVFLSSYVIHRRPDLWPDPERFDPDRFSPERVAARDRFSYIPFGVGRRQCVGNTFALTETVVLISMIVRAFDVELVDAHRVKPEAYLALRPDNLRARFRAAAVAPAHALA